MHLKVPTAMSTKLSLPDRDLAMKMNCLKNHYLEFDKVVAKKCFLIQGNLSIAMVYLSHIEASL